jgi:predicted outer membrane repeat protein
MRLAACCVAALLALATDFAGAATITVTSLLDDNAGCTLRNAVRSSSEGASVGGCAAGGASNTIVFASSGTITLNGAALNIYHNSLNIVGNGAAATVIDAQNLNHVFDNLDPGVPAAISIAWQNLTIKRGNATSAGVGAFSSAGAIFVDTRTTATLSNCVVSGNQAQSSGGAIENRGTLSINDCTFDSNAAAGQGGAIRNIGTLSISGSTFSTNNANSGGAIWHSSGSASQTLTVTNSTFVGNSAATSGGAIAADDTSSIGSVTLSHVTVTGNVSAGSGGGVYTNNGAKFTVDRTILALNSASTGPDCAAGAGNSLTSAGYSVFGTLVGCPVTGPATNDVVAAPNLGGLTNNGGPTQTVALLAGSVGIDIAPCSASVDQRGLARPFGAACDAGAFELQPAPPAGPLVFRAYVARNGSDSNPCTLPAPCRLLPAALAVVKDGGEVWMLDSANYNVGVVDIAKSVTIQAVPGAYGSVVANSADAIRVNAAGVEVTLRGIAVLNVAGSGNTGIRFMQGAQLTLEDIEAYGLSTAIAATAPDGLLAIAGCTIRDNAAGVIVQGTLRTTIDASSFLGNVTSGVSALGGAHVDVSNSVISGSTTGAAVAASSGASTQLALSASELSGNNIALRLEATVAGDLVQAVLDDVTLTHNTTGVAFFGTGTRTAFSRLTNTFRFNGTDVAGASLTPLTPK